MIRALLSGLLSLALAAGSFAPKIQRAAPLPAVPALPPLALIAAPARLPAEPAAPVRARWSAFFDHAAVRATAAVGAVAAAAWALSASHPHAAAGAGLLAVGLLGRHESWEKTLHSHLQSQWTLGMVYDQLSLSSAANSVGAPSAPQLIQGLAREGKYVLLSNDRYIRVDFSNGAEPSEALQANALAERAVDGLNSGHVADLAIALARLRRAHALYLAGGNACFSRKLQSQILMINGSYELARRLNELYPDEAARSGDSALGDFLNRRAYTDGDGRAPWPEPATASRLFRLMRNADPRPYREEAHYEEIAEGMSFARRLLRQLAADPARPVDLFEALLEGADFGELLDEDAYHAARQRAGLDKGAGLAAFKELGREGKVALFSGRRFLLLDLTAPLAHKAVDDVNARTAERLLLALGKLESARADSRDEDQKQQLDFLAANAALELLRQLHAAHPDVAREPQALSTYLESLAYYDGRGGPPQVDKKVRADIRRLVDSIADRDEGGEDVHGLTAFKSLIETLLPPQPEVEDLRPKILHALFLAIPGEILDQDRRQRLAETLSVSRREVDDSLLEMAQDDELARLRIGYLYTRTAWRLGERSPVPELQRANELAAEGLRRMNAATLEGLARAVRDFHEALELQARYQRGAAKPLPHDFFDVRRELLELYRNAALELVRELVDYYDKFAAKKELDTERLRDCLRGAYYSPIQDHPAFPPSAREGLAQAADAVAARYPAMPQDVRAGVGLARRFIATGKVEALQELPVDGVSTAEILSMIPDGARTFAALQSLEENLDKRLAEVDVKARLAGDGALAAFTTIAAEGAAALQTFEDTVVLAVELAVHGGRLSHGDFAFLDHDPASRHWTVRRVR